MIHLHLLRALDKKVGYRGSVLLFFSLWSGGQAVRLGWPAPETIEEPTFIYLSSLLPLSVLAIPWAICAGLCFIQAFTVVDWPAFALTAGVAVAWAFVYLAGGLRGAIPQGAWACVVQIFVAGVALRISRWPEPSRDQ